MPPKRHLVKKRCYRRSGAQTQNLKHQKRTTLYPLRHPTWDSRSSQLSDTQSWFQYFNNFYFSGGWIDRHQVYDQWVCGVFQVERHPRDHDRPFGHHLNLCLVWLQQPGIAGHPDSRSQLHGPTKVGGHQPGGLQGIHIRIHGVLPNCLCGWISDRLEFNLKLTYW